MKMIAAFLSQIDRRRRRTVFARGELSRIAVRQNAIPRLYQSQTMLSDHPAHPDIFLLDRHRLPVQCLLDLRYSLPTVCLHNTLHPV